MRRIGFGVIALLLAATAGCDATVTGGGNGDSTSAGDAASGLVGSGAVGAGGAEGLGGRGNAGAAGGGGGCADDSECVGWHDQTCEEQVAQWAATFEQPHSYHELETDTATCVMLGITVCSAPCELYYTGPACECVVVGSNGGTLYVGPVDVPCSNYGRAGDCLDPPGGFAGCEVGEHAFCADVCADLGARIAEDGQRVFEAEIRTARCDCGECRSVVRIDDRCIADQDIYTAYDCSLSDDEILAQADANPGVCPCEQ